MTTTEYRPREYARAYGMLVGGIQNAIDGLNSPPGAYLHDRDDLAAYLADLIERSCGEIDPALAEHTAHALNTLSGGAS